MVLLFLASLFSWAIIIEKALLLRREASDARLFNRRTAQLGQGLEAVELPGVYRTVVDAGTAEARDGAGAESRADYRERVERAMRAALAQHLDGLSRRVAWLASIGATSPFVGLFGTVWGIMHSFIGIAGSGETTLAVVAPGIAEALFATAMGLVAAIPAVVAYNKISGSLKDAQREALHGIGAVGNHLAKRHFEELEGRGRG
ncbi:MAG: MotA/TolQ/ExbB proton channel family protein [Methylobacteriaceae bacterium]|nr:MotA/TolQ/ExbB proton channel family protein [Methylobacteriaceae bacterium]